MKGSMNSSMSVKLRFFAATAVAALAFAASMSTKAGNDNRVPDVPAILQVTNGDKVHFHAYAVGVQIYVCTQSPTDPTVFTWTFKAPEAVLFDADGNVVGIHYAGPTWESESGSIVKGAVLQRAASPNTIPWLLLTKTFSEGPGIFADVTYIQRVNTTGGAAPATADASQLGQELRVPYTAEYYFYRDAK
jgi:hypothetical protein